MIVIATFAERVRHFFLQKYSQVDQETYVQVRTTLLFFVGVLFSLIVVMHITVVDGIQFYFLLIQTGVFLAAVGLIKLGYFSVAQHLAVVSAWLFITSLAFSNESYRHYAVYRFTSLYLFMLFIVALVMRKKVLSISITAGSVLAIGVHFFYQGPLMSAEEFRDPDSDDYFICASVLLLSTFIVNYIISKIVRLLDTARAEADQNKKRASDLVVSNLKLEKSGTELISLRNYLINVIDSMSSFVASIDGDGIVTQWNKGATRLTGISREDAVGVLFYELISRPALSRSQVEQTIAAGEPLFLYRQLVPSNNEAKYENISVSPLRGEKEDGAVVIIDDATDQVKMQEVLIQTEKMMSVGGLAAGMAHEINNPLAGILQNAQVVEQRLVKDISRNLEVAKELGLDLSLMRKYLEARDITRLLGIIRKSGIRAEEIVHNMLNFSRKENRGKVPADLKLLVENALGLAATDYDLQKKYDFRKIELVRTYQENMPKVLCVPAMIQQVLFNIFRNGAEAMQDAVEAGMTATAPPRLSITLQHSRDWASVCIEDNGPGMEPSIKSRIFEPFFTTKDVGKGTGLGLSVSYFIVVENHGGEMLVESQLGKGTQFTIKLPL